MSIYQNKVKVSVIIPMYNEAVTIIDCLDSLMRQTYRNIEIIVIDDGSRDNTKSKVRSFIHKYGNQNLVLLRQKHKGPGKARNLGAAHSEGDILVFVDADMTFDNDFLRTLIKPIFNGKTIGTFSQDEVLANPENYWARCWNMGRFSSAGVYTDRYLRSVIPNPSNKGGVFRAILKRKFDEVGGFETSGDYNDDESLVKKLGVRATQVSGTVFFHKNPSSLLEVWSRARWIGSGRNFTKGTKTKLSSLVKFFLPVSLFKSALTSFRFRYPFFLPFKVIYDLAIWISVIRSI